MSVFTKERAFPERVFDETNTYRPIPTPAEPEIVHDVSPKLGRLKALQLAHAAVMQRGESYGRPEAVFGRIAKRWSRTIGTEITAEHVALCMVDLKIERALACFPGGADHLDSLVDICGYAACAYEIAQDRTTP